MARFAAGKKAYGISDRSGFRYRLREMKREWNGALVGPDEYESKHPQLTPPRKINDPQALRDPRPDTHVDTYFAFKPVGGLNLEMTTGLGSVTVTVPTVTQTYTVTVVGGIFYLDGSSNPTITLTRGGRYVFDQSAASNAGHPIAFRTASDVSYTSGVTSTGTPGTAGARTVFEVPSDAPDSLKYYCTVHGNGMGNTITVQG